MNENRTLLLSFCDKHLWKMFIKCCDACRSKVEKLSSDFLMVRKKSGHKFTIYSYEYLLIHKTTYFYISMLWDIDMDYSNVKIHTVSLESCAELTRTESVPIGHFQIHSRFHSLNFWSPKYAFFTSK